MFFKNSWKGHNLKKNQSYVERTYTQYVIGRTSWSCTVSVHSDLCKEPTGSKEGLTSADHRTRSQNKSSWCPSILELWIQTPQHLAIITFFRGENCGVCAGNRGVSRNDLFHISSHGCPFHSCRCIGKPLHILQWVSLVEIYAGNNFSVFLRMVLFFPLTYHLHHPVPVPKLWAQGEQESLLATWLVIGICSGREKR